MPLAEFKKKPTAAVNLLGITLKRKSCSLNHIDG